MMRAPRFKQTICWLQITEENRMDIKLEELLKTFTLTLNKGLDGLAERDLSSFCNDSRIVVSAILSVVSAILSVIYILYIYCE